MDTHGQERYDTLSPRGELMSRDTRTSSQYDEQRSGHHRELVRSEVNEGRNVRAWRRRRRALKPREKGHPCPLGKCLRQFSTKYNAKAHIRVHNDEKPFSCAYGCGENFKWCSSKSVHEKAKCQNAASGKERKKFPKRKEHVVHASAADATKMQDKALVVQEAHGGILQELVATIARNSFGTQCEYGIGVDTKLMEPVVAGEGTCVSVGEKSQASCSSHVESVDGRGLLWIGGIEAGCEVSAVNGFMDYLVGANGCEGLTENQMWWAMTDPVRDMSGESDAVRLEWDGNMRLWHGW